MTRPNLATKLLGRTARLSTPRGCRNPKSTMRERLRRTRHLLTATKAKARGTGADKPRSPMRCSNAQLSQQHIPQPAGNFVCFCGMVHATSEWPRKRPFVLRELRMFSVIKATVWPSGPHGPDARAPTSRQGQDLNLLSSSVHVCTTTGEVRRRAYYKHRIYTWRTSHSPTSHPPPPRIWLTWSFTCSSGNPGKQQDL